MTSNPLLKTTPRIAIIGGGAGGMFCAIETARRIQNAEITVFEKTASLLSKVRISGGGRCNVTHAQFDPKLLSTNYPRGYDFLLPLFYRFQPLDTIEWFKREKITLLQEEDGRMFPSTNSSETIIQCFMDCVEKENITIKRGHSIERIEKESEGIFLIRREGEKEERLGPFDALVIATGSHPSALRFLEKMDISIIPQVPSLFTFNCPDSPLSDLAGVSVTRARVTIVNIPKNRRNVVTTEGPLLITHWGFSGPAILKLSAFCARELFEIQYNTDCVIDWAPDISQELLFSYATKIRMGEHGKKQIKNFSLVDTIPQSIYERFVTLANIPLSRLWSSISNKEIQSLIDLIKRQTFHMQGKTTYKNEFVTAGGVSLKEIDQKTLSSKKYPWMFFTGEVLDIDGITGGFNFQAAWTTAMIASQGIDEYIKR